MSDFSEAIEASREERRARHTGPANRKARQGRRRGLAERGGIGLACGCRWIYSGGAWRHVTPCRTDWLRDKPVGDQEMLILLGAAARAPL